MKNIFSDWRCWAVCMLVFLIFTQLVFAVPAPCSWLEAVWEAGDLLTFIGTVFLGAITIWQTQKANITSQQLFELENFRLNIELQPFVFLSDWHIVQVPVDIFYDKPQKLYIKVGNYDESEVVIGVSFTFSNTSNGLLTLKFKEAYSINNHFQNLVTNTPASKLVIPIGKTGEIIFCASKDWWMQLSGQRITWKFILENRFAERYQEQFDTVCIFNNLDSDEADNYCRIYPEKYSIGRFVRNDTGLIELEMYDHFGRGNNNGENEF